MDGPTLVAAFRTDVFDQVAPYLWSDADIYRYASEAQRMFCRLTEGIEDARSALTQIAVVPNTEWYTLSPLVLKVRFVTRNDTGRAVQCTAAEKAAQEGVFFDGRTGVLRALVTGLEKHAVRAYPMPTETVTLTAAVFRLPLAAITAAVAPEIDEQHHEALLKWMRHQAYAKPDSEVYDLKKSEDAKADFERYCAKAKAEQNRARHSAGAVAYAGL